MRFRKQISAETESPLEERRAPPLQRRDISTRARDIPSPKDVVIEDGPEHRRNHSRDGDDSVFDTGWAWMIVLGSFIIWFVTSSYHYVLSVLLFDIIEEYSVSVTMVTALMAVMHFSYCISTQILANLLLAFLSARVLSAISSFIYALSTLAIVFTSAFPVFFVASVTKYVVVGGICIPSLNLVSAYFQRYRSFAMGVSLLGMSAAAMMIPPMARYLREEYGFRGIFLILCGFELNTMVAALLLRPLRIHNEKLLQTKPRTRQKTCTNAGKDIQRGSDFSGNSKSQRNAAKEKIESQEQKDGRQFTRDNSLNDVSRIPKTQTHRDLTESSSSNRTVPMNNRVVITVLLNDCQLLLRTTVIQKQKQKQIPQSTPSTSDHFEGQIFKRQMSSSDLKINTHSPSEAPLLAQDPAGRLGNVTSIKPPLIKRRSMSCTMLELLETQQLPQLEDFVDNPVAISPEFSFWQWISYANLNKMARRYLGMLWWTQPKEVMGINQNLRRDSNLHRCASDLDLRQIQTVQRSQTDTDSILEVHGESKMGHWVGETNAISNQLSKISTEDDSDRRAEHKTVDLRSSKQNPLNKPVTVTIQESCNTIQRMLSIPRRKPSPVSKSGSGLKHTDCCDSATLENDGVQKSRECFQTNQSNRRIHADGTSHNKAQASVLQRHPSDSETIKATNYLGHCGPSPASERSNLGLMSSSRFGSTISLATSCGSVDSEERVPCHGWKAACLIVLRSKIKPPLLRNYLSVLIQVSYTLVYSGTFIEFFMPSFAVRQDESILPSKAALLVTMIGFANMVTRLGYMYLVDLRMLRPSRIIATTGLIMAVVSSCAVLYTNYGLLVLFAVAYGCVGFAGSVLNAPLIVQLVGIEDLGKMMSMCALVRGLLIAAQYPIHGFLIDVTDNFTASFYYIGASYALGSLLLLFEPLVRRAQITKVERFGERTYRQRMVKYIRPPLSPSASRHSEINRPRTPSIAITSVI